jgi:hypothetical protein
MARSWASVARGSASASVSVMPEWLTALVEDDKERERIGKVKQIWAEMDVKYGLPPRDPSASVSVLRASAPEWTPAPRCYYCGSAADTCPRCVDQRSWMRSHTLKPVLRGGRCSDHVSYGVPHMFFNKNMEEFIPQTCSGCREKHPWRPEDSVELTGFSYERANLEHPLKSPNGGAYNVVYVKRHRYIRLGQAKSSPEQVAAWAEAAYAKEMEFSGETKRAEAVRDCILKNDLNGVYLH